MGETLRVSDLESCDVLLYRGQSWFSRAICLFDASSVSHAALHLGGGRVAEATGEGVVRRRLEASVAETKRVLVRRLVPAPASMRPVRARAVAIVDEGHRYAYEQIVLLAFLCLTRRLVPTPSLSRFVRAVLDAATARVAALLRGAVEPMICSEFVYRTYDEADPDPHDVYALEIVPLPRSERVPGTVRLDAILAPGIAGCGRGIDRESLLARLVGPPSGDSIARRTRSQPRGREVPIESDRELQRLFEAHARERHETHAAPGPVRLGVELREAIERFAAAWAIDPQVRGDAHGEPNRPHPKRSRVPGATLRRPPLEDLFETAADFVTPGDLLRTKSLRTLGTLEPPVLRPAEHSASAARRTRGAARSTSTRAALRRRDPSGRVWSRSELESEIADLVARLTPGVDRSEISRATRFGRDLGWDEWSKLRLRTPVRRLFHVVLPAIRVKALDRVGSLMDAVWSAMEEVP